MWISSFAIRNPVITVVVTLALAVFGVFALATLDTDEFPEVNPPVVSLLVPYPGAAPETVEREVVTPLEEALRSLEGLDEITSTSLEGVAQLLLVFTFDRDVQQASQDVRDKLSQLRRDLPAEVEEPVLTRFDPNDLPVVSLALAGSVDVATLTRLADPGIVGALRGIPGVADVTVTGGAERQLVVELEPVALRSAGVGIPEVVEALRRQNLATPVGRVDDGLSERSIRLRGRLATPRAFEELVVAARAGPGGAIVRLGDVAAVRDGVEEPRSLALFNGERAVGIEVKKATSASTTAVSSAVAQQVHALSATLPAGVTLHVVQDAGTRVAASVADVKGTLVEGALLTVLVVALFLGSWRSTVITGLALPVSVLASFIAVAAFGFTLNSMSLLGLSLAIGVLIDDAIVVRENIVRHMERGADHVTAAREGTAEIGLAVAATTLAIVVVFVPVAFMGGIAEQWFAPFALTVAASVLVSLFVSFSLDPMLSALWPDPEATTARTGALRARLLRVQVWMAGVTTRYERLVAWSLRHRLLSLGVAALSFVGALLIPATGLVGSALFPEQDRSEISVNVEAPPGAGLEYTRRKAAEVEALARRWPETQHVYTTLGGPTGAAADQALVYVRLVDKAARTRSQRALEAELRAGLRRIAGVTAWIATGMFATGRQIELKVTGPDLAVLDALAERSLEVLEGVPGAVDVARSTRGRRPELDVVVDRALAASLGVSMAALVQSLRPAFAGIEAGTWTDPEGATRDVTVRLPRAARARTADLEALPVPITTVDASGVARGGVVPLGQLARVRASDGPAQIQHLDGARVVTVGANVEGAALSAVVAELERRTSTVQLPPGYAVVQGGETKSQREVFGRILGALGVAVVLMYLVLVVQLRSFLAPLPILASLPLSLIGVMLALLVTGSSLNLMSMIGLILLMGIVAKNAILLIDHARQAEARGVPRADALVQAGGARLRPIVMTSVAIVAGMLPVAIGVGEGGDFRAPLGRAVIGGVITSTALTLLVIPTGYDLLCGVRDEALRRLRALAPRPASATHVPADAGH